MSDEAFPLFGIVWPSARVLCELLLEYDVKDKHILDIGCGMALVSILLKLRGANVTAMDIHPTTGALLQVNVAQNQTAPIPFVEGSWSDEAVDLGTFDLIVASDILYEPKHVNRLAPFLSRHASREVLIVDPRRGQQQPFLQAMEASGFSVDSSQPDFSDQEGHPYDGIVYRFTR